MPGRYRLSALLFLPIVLGVYKLYQFATPAPGDKIIEWRGWYMDPPWWAIRALVYFVMFSAMAYLLSGWGAKQDAAKDPEESAQWLGRATAFSGVSIVIFVLACDVRIGGLDDDA